MYKIIYALFCLIIFIVPSDNSINSNAFERSPFTIVTSEAFMATSVPVPIAIERLAFANAGASLTPFFNGQPENWRSELLCQCNGNENYFTQRIIFDEHYKYVFNSFDFDELYDLKNDPLELVNLAHPSLVPQDSPHQGLNSDRDSYTPWPKLKPELEPVRKAYMGKMWRQMQIEEDMFFNGFLPCALANYGPFSGIEK